jgi:hypothetical protein
MLKNDEATLKRKTYLNIEQGRFILKTDGGEESYTTLSGKLKDISKKERTFRGETITYWYIDISDENGTLYSIGLPYSSGVFKSIVNCLAAVNSFDNDITIKTYSVGEYSKVSMLEGENKLSWKYSQLPPVTEAIAGGKKIKDDSRRMQFFEDIVKDIQRRLNPLSTGTVIYAK